MTLPISNRESEVLVKIAQGYKNKEIAHLLCISPSTTRNHTTNIYVKLKVRNRAEATRAAFSLGLLNDLKPIYVSFTESLQN